MDKEWRLLPATEYRFELDPAATLAIKVRLPPAHPAQLVHGHAEIFGAELAEGKSYLFAAECKAAVFTWHGCTIQMSPPVPPRVPAHYPPRLRSPLDRVCLGRDPHGRLCQPPPRL